MVSFQCEGCGDVQTKKKLDSHRNHCHAPFTCIDCMRTFHGTEYRSHTSCMTEDQKYQGHLYREKPSKASKRKSVSILEPADQNALVQRKIEVTDLAEIDVPPAVPTPPPAVGARDSVFDYMIEDGPQGTPKILFASKKESQDENEADLSEGEMMMKNDAPSVFSRSNSSSDYKNKEERNNSTDYETHGFSYGTEPINPRPLDMNGSSLSLDFMTPAAKTIKTKLDKHMEPSSVSHSRTNSASEKKRKRGHVEELNGGDVVLLDAPDTIVRQVVDTPGIVHSGLTGGLSRMVTNDEDFPFNSRSPSTSPDPDRGPAPVRKPKKNESPGSPLKKTRRSKDDSGGLGITIKGHAGKILSMGGVSLDQVRVNSNGALVRTRRRTSSSDNTKEGEKRDRKKHKVTRHNGTASANIRHEPRSRRQASDDSFEGAGKKKMKSIEYHKHDSNSDSDEMRQTGGDAQIVVFGAQEKERQLCDSFLSCVRKGSHSTNGYSVHKVLKRWYRDREADGATSKQKEEDELWRLLRLKRNDRGEIVLF